MQVANSSLWDRCFDSQSLALSQGKAIISRAFDRAKCQTLFVPHPHTLNAMKIGQD